MLTTCLHCNQSIELEFEVLQQLQGRQSFACPTCGGAVVVPVIAHASTQLRRVPVIPDLPRNIGVASPANHLSDGGLPDPTFESPTEAAEVSGESGDSSDGAGRAAALQSRTVWIVASALILVLGAVTVALALRQEGTIQKIQTNITYQTIQETFFNELIASGVTTARRLDAVESIRPYGTLLVGVSREELSAEEAEDLARKTGATVLEIDEKQPDYPEALRDWAQRTFSEAISSAAWVRQGKALRGFEADGVVDAVDNDTKRKVLLRWQGPEELRGAVVGTVITFETVVDEKETIRFEPRGGLVLDESTRLEVERIGSPSKDAPALGMRLERGRVFGRRDETVRSTAEFRLRPGKVQVQGAEFFVEVDGAEALVAVKDGAVTAISRTEPGRRVEVAAGFKVRITLTGVGDVLPIEDRDIALLEGADVFWRKANNIQWTINPKFEDALPFSVDGLAAAKSNGIWGYIDFEGKWVIEPRWESVHTFHEGRAAVMVDGKWGFIDRAGSEVAPPTWKEVGPFSEGRARFRRGDKWGFIDLDGSEIIAAEWELSESQRTVSTSFRHGMVPVMRDKKIGILGLDGKLLTPIEWDRITRITEEGVGVLKSIKQGAFRYGRSLRFLDRQGRVFFDAADCELRGDGFESPGFHEGLAAIDFSAGVGQRIFYIRPSGEIAFVLPGKSLGTSNYYSFSNGLAMHKKGPRGEELVCINKQGERVFSLEGWECLLPFSEGFAIVCEHYAKPSDQKEVALVDRKGTLKRLNVLFFGRHYTGGGHLRVGLDPGIGFINREGEVFAHGQGRFLLRSYHKGLYFVTDSPRDGGVQAVVDASGKEIAPEMPVVRMPDTLAAVHHNKEFWEGGARDYFEIALERSDPVPWRDDDSKLYGYFQISN